MKLKNFLTEKKNMNNTMIGYGINEKPLEPLINYMKSWFERYDIEYNEPAARHITLAQITSKHSKDELTRLIDKLPFDCIFKPNRINVFSGVNVERIFFVLEYKPTRVFLEAYDIIKANCDIRIFDRPRPHISLFNFEKCCMEPTLINDILLMSPNLPKIKPTNVDLWNSKFQIEFSKKL